MQSDPDREGISLAHRAVRGENEALSRLSESENASTLAPEEQRDDLLAEAVQIRKFDHETLTQGMGKLNQEQW